jgi:hypothetical protein
MAGGKSGGNVGALSEKNLFPQIASHEDKNNDGCQIKTAAHQALHPKNKALRPVPLSFFNIRRCLSLRFQSRFLLSTKKTILSMPMVTDRTEYTGP